MSDQIVITDVGPRDGLQNQPKILSTDERTRLVAAIATAGVPAVEVGSFVRYVEKVLCEHRRCIPAGYAIGSPDFIAGFEIDGEHRTHGGAVEVFLTVGGINTTVPIHRGGVQAPFAHRERPES